ncbi:MAG: hypothetical protein WCZ65_10655 [Lysobacteraceae bacterium]
MKSTLKQGGLLASLVAASAFVWSGHAQANDCVVDIALAQGKDNWYYHGNPSTRQIGYWDVDNGGAETQGTKLGEHFINLSAVVGPMSTQECIEDIKLTAGDWDQQRNPPIGYTEVAWWDVDDGGSLDSDNRSSKHRMTLFVKKMDKTENPPSTLRVIQELGMTISNDKPSFRPGTAHSRHTRFTQVGWWDVDRDTGCGFVGNDRSCGSYGAVLLTKKVPFVNAEEIQAVTYTGRWEMVNACRGSHCGETSYELSVGAEQGKEISRSSTFAKSLSLMLGTEVKAGGKAGVPFVAEGTTEVTAKVEVTGQISSEQQDAIMNSFTISRQSTTAVSCSGASDMWQWKSTLRIQRATRVEDVNADSLLTVCAPTGVRPKSANDISWDPEVSASAPVAGGAPKFPLSGGATFERGGAQVHSPSGSHYAALQSDGNFVVKTREGGYVWGLNRVLPADKFGKIARITFQADGNLVAHDASGGYIWSALHAEQPTGTTLRLSDSGSLQIVLPNNTVAWEAK